MPDKKNKMIKKTVVITGYRCNNRCRFCLDEEKRGLVEKTTTEVKSDMLSARKRGTTYLELIGGEVLIRPDILGLIRFARRLGFTTVFLATNGRMLAYRRFAEDLVKAGLTDIVFSLHGHTTVLHDHLTRVPGSFRELMAGLGHIKEILGTRRIGINTTIVRQNYRFLPAIGAKILSLGISNVEFIFVDPTYGAAQTDFRRLVPKISAAAPYIRRCLVLGREAGARHWDIRYVPLCYFADLLNQVSELKEAVTFSAEHIAPDFINTNVVESRRTIARAKTRRCRGCRLYSKCEGIWREYLKQYGDRELKPVK